MKIHCCCCGRQIVSYDAEDNKIVGSTLKDPTQMGLGNFCCHKCSHTIR